MVVRRGKNRIPESSGDSLSSCVHRSNWRVMLTPADQKEFYFGAGNRGFSQIKGRSPYWEGFSA
jgi:hypothetical protein